MDADELKAKREKLGLSQQGLADALGVHVMTVSRWERGERSIPAHLSLAIKAIEIEKAAKKKR